MSETHKYTVKGTPMSELLFKLLMQNMVIETRATYFYLRENLTNLETHITTVNTNIQTFNQHKR